MNRYLDWMGRIRLPFLGLLLLGLLLLAACGGSTVTTTTAQAVETVDSTTTTNPYPARIEPIPDDRRFFAGMSGQIIPDGMSLAAKVTGEVEIYDSPSASGPSTTLPAETILGTATVLGVAEGPIDGWVRVLLPVRPNNSTAWVKASDVTLFVVDGRLVIDLSDRTLAYYEKGVLLLESKVAIGSASNPTPEGQFFVTDNVTLANPNSPWGPYALGLSARSETITEYNGGDGIIGIHGTNRPGSIGKATSLGCVRLPNDVITYLHTLIAVGTPVDIVA